jgi:hypothetical protein
MLGKCGPVTNLAILPIFAMVITGPGAERLTLDKNGNDPHFRDPFDTGKATAGRSG